MKKAAIGVDQGYPDLGSADVDADRKRPVVATDCSLM
jgi:hypothetical protein